MLKKCFKKVQTVLQSDSSLRNFSQRVIIVCTVPVYFCLVLWSLSRTFCWTRFKSSSSGLLLCDQGVLWWQSCDNSYNFSQILTIFTQIKRKNRCTFKNAKLFFFICICCKQIFPREPEPATWTGAGSRLDRLHNTGCTYVLPVQ